MRGDIIWQSFFRNIQEMKYVAKYPSHVADLHILVLDMMREEMQREIRVDGEISNGTLRGVGKVTDARRNKTALDQYNLVKL